MQQDLSWNAIAHQLMVAQKRKKISGLHHSLFSIAFLNHLHFHQRWASAIQTGQRCDRPQDRECTHAKKASTREQRSSGK